MQVKMKNMPRLRLADLLRRRKMTLQQFLNENMISSYGVLTNKCLSMGVQPPPEDEYLRLVGQALPVVASDQQNGVIVIEIEPYDVIKETTGEKTVEHEEQSFDMVETSILELEPTEGTQKRRKKKKEEPLE